MRLPEVVLLLLASLGLSACLGSRQPPHVSWTTGFWFWEGSDLDPTYSGKPLDVLFVQAGHIRSDTDPRPGAERVERWYAYGQLPDEMPAARDYWLVYRYERQGVPGLPAAAQLAEELTRLQSEARQRNLHVVGIQLDIDSPTSALPRYAEFLAAVRKGLPPGFEISITALLDWFRTGTAIAGVIQQVDEFVPQFYDVGDPSLISRQVAIAARIDPQRWDPIFNRFHKRFRIGISTFGRTRLVHNAATTQTGNYRLELYGDLQPLDLAANPGFELRAERNQADETILNYRASRKLRLGYEDLEPGDTLQFILSTPESIRAAVHNARQIKGYNAGVVFFRWPAENETWALQPDEVLDTVSEMEAADKPPAARPARVHVVPGGCAVVECADLYLESPGPLAPLEVCYRIHASIPLEYFLPQPNIPARLAGSSDVAVALPPYCGRGRLYLGRAVSSRHAEYSVEVEP
ncbi:DUF3142 domain-containing protein [uncultured Paludibaculum sp.]|uniref:DUF3142 domain-containing protein n=1 Tax=uncultured Paludibaculum sp. TaxID=1765020 RepID=UPI002AAADEA9|nr:DUF3142 domain-containing protein [uncultured Paludibaculum sp.]